MNKKLFQSWKKSKIVNQINYKEMEKQKSKAKMATGRWTSAEHNKFMDALQKYGRDWNMVQKKVRTRTLLQVRSHAQKVFLNMPDHDIDALVGYQGGSVQEKKKLRCKKNSKDYQEQKTILVSSKNNANAKIEQIQQKEQDNLLDATNQTQKSITNLLIENQQKNAVSALQPISDEKQRLDGIQNMKTMPTPVLSMNHPIYILGSEPANLLWNPLVFFTYQN